MPHSDGNVLWDCVTLLDDETEREIDSRGGLHAIAISHPHYYSTMVEWAHRFDCPVWLHEADRAVGDARGPEAALLVGSRRTTSATA